MLPLLKRLLASAESRKTQIKWGEMYRNQNASVWSLLKEGRRQPHTNPIWENSFASCPPLFSPPPPPPPPPPTPLLISAVSGRKAQVVGSIGIKKTGTMLMQVRVQELCESRGGHPGLPVVMSLTVSVDVKQLWTMHTHWSVCPSYVSRHPRTLSPTSSSSDAGSVPPVQQCLSPRVSFHSGGHSLPVSVQPLRAFACINSCARVKNPKHWQP